MNIYLNGASRHIEDASSLQGLLQQLALGDKRVAVEVNRAIVPQSLHTDTILHPGDRVEIVEAIGGG